MQRIFLTLAEQPLQKSILEGCFVRRSIGRREIVLVVVLGDSEA